MSTKALILGTGDAFCTGGRRQTGFVFQSSAVHWMVDCGFTTLQTCQELNYPHHTIDIIFITHFHGDHYGGLPSLLLDRYLLKKYYKPLLIVVPPEDVERVKILNENIYAGTWENYTQNGLKVMSYIEFQYIQNQFSVEFQYYSVLHSPLAYPYGLKIKVENQKFGFSGDTSWTPALKDIAHGTDVFFCECNFFNTQGAGHLNWIEIENHKLADKTNRLLLHHFGHEMLINQKNVSEYMLSDFEKISI